MRVGLMAWKPCRTCKADVKTDPLPDGWSYTVKTFKDGISHVSVHTAECPRRFKKIEIPDVE